ncbi:MAG: roadblock/LC7 domain-containing protein [Acidobacteriota bacterium]
MFGTVLDSIVSKVEGTQAAVVMGMDGIAIEKRILEPSANVETLAAEYTSLLRNSASKVNDLALGLLQELVVSTDSRVIATRMITADYFVLIVLGPDGNVGRARFELRKAQHVLAEEFA